VRYLVYGAGAVGGLLGASLALAGHQVVFLARPARAESFRQHGIRLSGDVPSRVISHPRVETRLDQALAQGLPDAILLTVKAYDVGRAAQELSTALEDPPPVVSFLNGIGSEELLGSVIGLDRVVPATLTTAVQIGSDGGIRVERQRGIGLAGNHAIIPALDAEFKTAGLSVRIYAHAGRMKWSKLMTNIVANASSAILGWSAAQVYQHPGIAHLEIEAQREVLWAMRRLGFSPVNLPGVPVALMGWGLRLPASWIRPFLGRIVSRGRGEKKPSLHYDIGRGKSEVAWLHGPVVRLDEPGHPHTPANALLLETMQQLVDDASAADRFRDNPEQLIQLAVQRGVKGMHKYAPVS
jgi:2-dehydropantoate 2-reductase